LSVHLVIKRF